MKLLPNRVSAPGTLCALTSSCIEKFGGAPACRVPARRDPAGRQSVNPCQAEQTSNVHNGPSAARQSQAEQFTRRTQRAARWNN